MPLAKNTDIMRKNTDIMRLEMVAYIRKRMNHVLKIAHKMYCTGQQNNGFSIAFVRKEEWECEEFDGMINVIIRDDEKKLTSTNSGTDWAIKSTMLHDTTHKDGLPKKSMVEIMWWTSYESPFNELEDNISDDAPVCNEVDSDDEREDSDDEE